MHLPAFLLGLLSLLLQIAPAGPGPAPARAEADAGPPVLVIDGHPVDGDEFGMWLVQTQGEKRAVEFGRRVFVIEREAKRLGVELTPEELAAKVEADFQQRIAGAFLGRRDDWLAELARTGRSEGGLRRSREVEYRPELLAAKLVERDRVVPEYLIEREWEHAYGRQGRRYDLRMIYFHVVVPSPAEPDREAWREAERERKQAALERAQAVRARVLAGEDLGKLAVELSDDPETRDRRGAPKGGFRHYGWPETFLKALDALGPGDLSEPLYARGGWWLVEVRGVETTPLEKVRDTIVATLLARGADPSEVGALQERLAEGVQVRVLPSLYAPHEGGERPAAHEPALLVDGEPVTRGEYARWLLHTRGEIEAGRFVQEWLVRRRAAELGIEVDDAAVEQRAQDWLAWRMLAGNHNRESWIAYLAISGGSEEAFLRDLRWRSRIDLLAEEMMRRERVVTDADLRRRFADEYGPDGERIEARVIRVPIDISMPAAGLSREDLAALLERRADDARKAALELRERILAGEDFAELARKHSVDASARDGGALPGRFDPGSWQAGVGPQVVELAVGEVSQPLFYGTGWLLFEVTARRKVTFEQVEAELRRELAVERPANADVTGWKNALLERSRWELAPAMYSD